jgi:hypothetical protein
MNANGTCPGQAIGAHGAKNTPSDDDVTSSQRGITSLLFSLLFRFEDEPGDIHCLFVSTMRVAIMIASLQLLKLRDKHHHIEWHCESM